MTGSDSNFGDEMQLSIITIHLNNFTGLEKTLESLRPVLGIKQVEWIVVDGGSDLENDKRETLTHARSLAAHFISKPDNGIYDAMNKGTQLATGEFVLYMNAGDGLHPDFQYEKLVATPFTNEEAMIWGRYDVRDSNESVYSRRTRHPGWLRYGTAVCHQAVFFKRSVLGSTPYNTDLSIAADYDLICRLYTHGEKINMLNMPVCIFDLVGESGKDKRLTLREESIIRRTYFPITSIFNGLIFSFKLLLWHLGTLMPSFRRAWSRYF
ncbi:glycosyltransferase [Pseudomonadota bacterium]